MALSIDQQPKVSITKKVGKVFNQALVIFHQKTLEYLIILLIIISGLGEMFSNLSWGWYVFSSLIVVGYFVKIILEKWTQKSSTK